MNQPNIALSYADRLELASHSRHAAIKKAFNTQLFSLTSLMGPISDGPEWPSDASWLAFSHEGCACIMSDGLSDPWVERNKPDTGLGLEIFVESPDIAFSSASPMAVADTWLFPMTAELSHTLASYPRLCEKLRNNETLSLRFNIEHIKDGRGLVGALLHRPPHLSELEIATGSIAVIAATLLTGAELSWLAGKGETGRKELLEALYREGIGAMSVMNRGAVVGL